MRVYPNGSSDRGLKEGLIPSWASGYIFILSRLPNYEVEFPSFCLVLNNIFVAYYPVKMYQFKLID